MLPPAFGQIPNLLFQARRACGTDAELIQTHAQKEPRRHRVGGKLAAHAGPDPRRVRLLNHLADRPQHRRMEGVIEVLYLLVSPVYRK
jgi:hypothetical protein